MANKINRKQQNMSGAVIYTYDASTDIFNNTSISASTWTDVYSDQNFTVSSSSSVLLIAIQGTCQLGNTNIADNIARINIDSAGTPVLKKFGGVKSVVAAQYGNPFGGSAFIAIAGLSAGVHTIKVQIFTTAANKAYLRASASPDTEYLSVQITEIGG